MAKSAFTRSCASRLPTASRSSSSRRRWSSSPSHKAGENVDVLYDPDDPSDAKLSGFFDLWGLPGIFLFIGAVFVGVPITIIWLTGS